MSLADRRARRVAFAVGVLDREGELEPLCARLGLCEKLLLAGEPFRRRRADGEPESVQDFFLRRLGPGGAFLAAALQTGIYAGDPAQLEVGSAFPSLGQLEREHGSLVKGAGRSGRARSRARSAAGLSRVARLASFGRAAAHPGLALAGSALHGVSMIDCLRDSARAGRAIAASLRG